MKSNSFTHHTKLSLNGFSVVLDLLMVRNVKNVTHFALLSSKRSGRGGEQRD
jgi:hypothetical protein